MLRHATSSILEATLHSFSSSTRTDFLIRSTPRVEQKLQVNRLLLLLPKWVTEWGRSNEFVTRSHVLRLKSDMIYSGWRRQRRRWKKTLQVLVTQARHLIWRLSVITWRSCLYFIAPVSCFSWFSRLLCVTQLKEKKKSRLFWSSIGLSYANVDHGDDCTILSLSSSSYRVVVVYLRRCPVLFLPFLSEKY